MGVNRAFQITEIGLIPQQWKVAKLGDYATFKTGPFGSALHQSDYVYDGIPVVNPMQIVDGKIVPTASMTITALAARRLADFQLHAGDVVIGRRGDMGRCAYVRAEEHGWLCGTGSMIIKTRPSLDARYIQRVLASAPIITAIENASVGSTMINLNQGTLGNLSVPIPETKAEQEAIAEALSDADALIESLEQLILKKRQIKQGVMQELLTGEKRLPGFSGEWVEKPIGGDIDLLTGFPFPSNRYSQTGIRLLRGSNVKRGLTDWSAELLQCWPSVSSDIEMYRLRAGDLVIAMDGSLVGRSYARLADKDLPALLLQRVARIRSAAIDVGLLTQHVGSDRFVRYCDSVKTVTAIPHISPKDLRNFRIARPLALDEQVAIATVLSEMDADLVALETKLAKVQEIKQGMMQELLTGRIRLI